MTLDTWHSTCFKRFWNVRGAWVTFHCALQFHTFYDSIFYWQEMPTTSLIDEYETNDYISCLHGNDMDICMLKTFFDALGCVRTRSWQATQARYYVCSNWVIILQKSHCEKKKHNWLYSSSPSTFVTTCNITDCSSSVAIATAHYLRKLVKSICAANGHLVPVILCKECMLVDHGFQTISTCWQHQGRLCQTV